MQKYKYTAVNLQNQRIKGTFLANDENDLAAQLAKQSLFLISAKAYKNDTPSSFFTLTLGGKVPLSELTSFCRQFSIMQNAGLPILDSLDILRNQQYSSYFRSLLDVIYTDVKSGLLLSEAFDKHKRVFPHFFKSMVRVGEQSGRMEQVFSSLADYYERDRAVRGKVKSALSYPMMLLAMTVGIVILMMAVVIPTFRTSMEQMNVEITGITETVYAVSDFLINYWNIIILVTAVVVLSAFLISRSEGGAYLLDKLRMTLPIIRSVQINLITARLSRAFGLLISSGMDLNSAMDNVEAVIGNRYMKKKFHYAAESVRHGMSLSVAFETYRLFPRMMVQMVSIGENTGTLDEAMMRSAAFFDSQTEASVNSLVSRLQPILLILMGLIVGTLFIAVYSPMLSIMNGIGV